MSSKDTLYRCAHKLRIDTSELVDLENFENSMIFENFSIVFASDLDLLKNRFTPFERFLRCSELDHFVQEHEVHFAVFAPQIRVLNT